MNASTSFRLSASFLAILAFAFCCWQLTTSVLRVHTATTIIAAFHQGPDNIDLISPEQWVIQTSSLGAAGAQLQARLRASSRAADISLTRVEVQPPDPAKPEQVRASAQASGSTRAIAKFIFELENTHPALVIERANISKGVGADLEVDLVLLARAQIEEVQ